MNILTILSNRFKHCLYYIIAAININGKRVVPKKSRKTNNMFVFILIEIPECKNELRSELRIEVVLRQM